MCGARPAFQGLGAPRVQRRANPGKRIRLLRCLARQPAKMNHRDRNADFHLTPHKTMKYQPPPSLLTPFLPAGVFLQSCASSPAATAVSDIERSKLVSRAACDDRKYDINRGTWDTPPPYARFG